MSHKLNQIISCSLRCDSIIKNQSRFYCPAPRKTSAIQKRVFKVVKKKDLFVDLSAYPQGSRGVLKEYNRTLA